MTTTYQRPFSGQLGALAAPVSVYTVAATQAVLKEIRATNTGGPVAPPAALALAGGVATDPSGNLYWVETSGFNVKKLTPDGRVTTFAGAPGASGMTDGVGGTARFSTLQNIVVDATGTYAYVADSGNHRIRRITLADGTVLTIAGNGTATQVDNTTGTSGTLASPAGLALSPDGTKLYVGVSAANGPIRVVALTAPYALSTLSGYTAVGQISGMCIDAAGANLYLCRHDNTTFAQTEIAKVVVATGVATVIAANRATAGGHVNGASPTVSDLHYLCIDEPAAGNTRLYVTEVNNSDIRSIDFQPAGGGTFQYIVNSLVGPGVNILGSAITGTPASTEGIGRAAAIQTPVGICKRGDSLFVTATAGATATNAALLWRIDLRTLLAHHIAGDVGSTLSSATYSCDGNALYNQTGYYNVYVVPNGQSLDTGKHCLYRNRSAAWQGSDVINLNRSLQAGDKVYLEALSPGLTFDLSSLEVT